MCETHTHLLSLTVAHCHSLSLTVTHCHSLTLAQAEGAIEGSAALYEVATPYETRFAFSRFDAAEQFSSPAVDSGRVETGGAGDASAMD